MAVNVIAIDGPAASGKSSAARLLAEAIPGSVYVNTGSMYRAVAWKARKCGLDPLHPDPEKLASMLETTEMRFVPTPTGRELEVDGVLPGVELRTEEISRGAAGGRGNPRRSGEARSVAAQNGGGKSDRHGGTRYRNGGVPGCEI